MSWDLNAYQIFQIGWTIAMGLFSLHLYLVGKEQVRSKDLASYKTEVRQELVDHSHRIAELENLIRHMPTHMDIGEVLKRLDETNQRLAQVMGEFKSMSHTVSMVNQYLITRGEQKLTLPNWSSRTAVL